MCVDPSKQVSGFVFMPSDLHMHTHFFQQHPLHATQQVGLLNLQTANEFSKLTYRVTVM